MTERKRPVPLMPLVALTVVAMLLGGYVGGYLWLGKRHVFRAQPTGGAPVVAAVFRDYRHKWQVAAFQPAAYVESLCIGVKVYVEYDDPVAEGR